MGACRRLFPLSVLLTAGVVGVTAGGGQGWASVPPSPAATASPLGAAPGVTRASASAAAPVVSADGEVPSLRTASSRTFTSRAGVHRTRLFAAPVNYRDGQGGWQKIDASLVGQAEGGWRAGAVAVPVSVPADLSSGAVTVGGAGDAAVSFRLAGAAPVPASVVGAVATCPGVLAGTSVRETVTGSGVREEFVLASAGSVSTVTETAVLPAGASLVALPGGGARVRGADGGVLGAVSAPTVSDAAGVSSASAARLTVAGNRITVGVDRGWLSAPGRVFPVTVDPDYTGGAGTHNTQLESGTRADVNYGSASNDCLGRDPANGNATARIALNYPDLGASIPRDARVDQVQIGVNVTSVSAATQIETYDLTAPFNQYEATWNSRLTGTGWATPGADFTAAGSSPTTISSTDTAGTYHSWYVNPAWVRGWIDSNAYGQGGFLLKATNESTAGLVCVAATPAAAANQGSYLNVFWQYRTGLDPASKFFTHRIDDHETVHVNIANGNLVDTPTEFSTPAPGVPLVIARTYNSFQARQPWMNGLGWWQTPADSGAYSNGPTDGPYGFYDGSFGYADPASGAADYQVWHPADYANTGAGFTPPPGANAARTASGPDTVITSNTSQTQVKITAASDYQVAAISSRTGLTEQVNHGGTVFGGTTDPDVSTVVDTAGRSFSYTYGGTGGTGYLTGITGPTVNGGPVATGYTYQGGPVYDSTLANGELLSATDAAGGLTSYGYDSSQRLTRITSPAGRVTTLTYNPAGQVGSMTSVTNTATGAGSTYLFAYTAPTVTGGTGTTVVTDPNSHTTTYTWDPDDRVVATTDANGHTRSTSYTANNDSKRDRK